MTGLLRKPLAWALALLLAAGVGFAFWRNRTPSGPAPAGAVVAPSPFAAAANGKVDVEGGMIQVAARRAGIIRDVLVNEGDAVVPGRRRRSRALPPDAPPPPSARPGRNSVPSRSPSPRPAGSVSAFRPW
jgi:hypothetical protein